MTEKLGRKITLIAVLIVLAIAVLILPSRPFRLGLDLQGGTRLVYRFDFEEAARRGQISKADLSNKEGLLDSFKEIIHQRLDPKGVKEISIRKQGSDQLVIELPGAAEFQSETITWKLGAELAAGERTQLVLDPGPGEGATAKEKTEAVEKIKAFPLTGGMVRVGSESIQYTVREGNVLRALQRGMDKTEVAGHASGALVDLLTSNELETIITSIGDLQFMIVAQQNDPELARFNTDLGKETQKRDAWIKANPGRSIEEFNLLESAQGGPAGSLRWYPKRVERGQIETPAVERLEGVLVTSNPEWIFTGSDLKRVEPSQDQSGLPAVHLEIADAKKSAFTEFTTTHIGRQMAIVLNREIATDPVIKSKLPGSCVIEGGAGGFTLKQVQDLVRILKSGSLRVKPTLLDRARVGASLGQDYILTGIYSAFAALALIVVFMLVFYRKLGVFSVIGLVLNLLFLMAGLAFLRATITLPGVAGIILTLGMAVDGNILIYERLREELARGLKLIQACKASFERAAVAIIDSNLTTLISGVILQYVGTGPIRGFAVTLNIGILSTLFTVIVVTEALVLLDLKRGTTKLTMAPMFAAPKIRFMANYKKFLYTSWAIALLGFVLLASSPREKVWGIDFQGGFTMKVRTAEPMQVDALRERVSKIAGAIGESEVKEISDSAVAGRGYTVFSITYKRTDNSLDTSKTSSGETGESDVRRALQDVLAKGPVIATVVAADTDANLNGEIYFESPHPVADIAAEIGAHGYREVTVEPLAGEAAKYKFTAKTDKDRAGSNVASSIASYFESKADSQKVPYSLLSPVLESNLVGPQVGAELRNKAVIALFLALIGTMFYLRIRFAEYGYALGVVVALVHDVLMTLAGVAVAIQTGFVHAEIDLAMVAAFLTIIGYSQNDTIVIFDRVRENRAKSNLPLEQVLDDSINQTLSRTILTTSTVLLTLAVIFAFNFGTRNVLESFSFVMLCGVLSGAYSTVYIASPVLLWYERRQARKAAGGGAATEPALTTTTTN